MCEERLSREVEERTKETWSCYPQLISPRPSKAMTKVISVKDSQNLQKVQRERRNRRHVVWIIHDVRSKSLLLCQKLNLAVDFINETLADFDRERVNVAGLFEAAGTSENRVDGHHKFRYRVLRTTLSEAHAKFNQMRNTVGIQSAMILTNAPHAYALGSAEV